MTDAKALKPSDDTVRVLRVLEYIGPRSWVESTVRLCAVPVNGERSFGKGQIIKSALLGTTLEVIEKATERSDLLDAVKKAQAGDIHPDHPNIARIAFGSPEEARAVMKLIGDMLDS